MEHQYPNFLAPEEHKKNEPPQKSSRTLLLIGFIVFLCLGAIITHVIIATDDTVTGPGLHLLQAKRPTGILGKLKEFIFHKGENLDGLTDDRINILILGEGGPGHDGPYLTDTIIIASIKPSTNQVAMVSIPRDLVVNIPGYGLRKINNANAFAEMKVSGSGPATVQNVIQNTFDIPIHYYVRVDFAAFEELIDKVGGVKIEVDNSFTDYEYPIKGREDAIPISSRYKVLKFTSGIQYMDGKTALEYARSRHGDNGEGSDYARSRRQQKVLLALKDKLLSFQTLANPGTINNILTTIDANILTNLSISDMITFAGMAAELNTKEIINVPLDDSPTGHLHSGYDAIGAFVLTPKTGNFDEITTAIKNIFDATSTTSITKMTETKTPIQETLPVNTNKTASATVEVHNGTWAPGLAAQIKTRLTQKQFVVQTIGNSINRPQTKSGIYIVSNSADLEKVKQLREELNIPVQKTVPTGENYANTTDILVILGEDFGG